MRGLRPTAETAFGIMTALTGLGVLTIALAPLAVPILILTVASLLPLLAVGLAIGLPIALIAAVWLAVRALLRRQRQAPRLPESSGRLDAPRRARVTTRSA